MHAGRAVKKEGNRAAAVIGAAILSLAVSFVLVVLYAVALKKELLDTGTMSAFTTAIKAVCAAIAGITAANRQKSRLWLYGAAGGASYAVLAFIVFSLVAGAFELNAALLSDVAMGALAGVLSVMVKQALK